MQGAGNDYLYFDCFEEALPFPEAAAKKLSDRHFSVGGDGIILLEKSAVADAKMRIFNADGSEGEMCGNGVRCAAKFLYEIKGIHKREISIETRAGIKILKLETEDGKVVGATANMGLPVFEPSKIPVRLGKKDAFFQTLQAGGRSFLVHCLSMGNPHCVIFQDGIDALNLSKIGPLFERHEAFPNRTNVEFAEVLGENSFKVRVFERGSGETLACGTGACAAAVAAVKCGYAQSGKEILVRMRGGALNVCVREDGVFLTGGAHIAFFGTVEID